MLVRSAHEQGLLSRPSLNMVQAWALSYWLGMKQAETNLALLGTTNPEPVVTVDAGGGDRGQAFGGEPELPVTDPNDLDVWFDNLTQKRGMTGAEVAALGWAEGPGVRV
jgi:hypothetical protein